MPVTLPPLEKAAFIAIVNVYDPIEADRLLTVLNTYDDIVTAVGRQLTKLASELQLLTELMNVFADNNELLAAKIIYGLSNAANYSDPRLIINSALTGNISITANSPGLGIMGTSTVGKVVLSSPIVLDNLYMGPPATLKLLDSRASGSCVTRIWLPFLKNKASTIVEVAKGSCIGAVKVDEGSVYGGIATNVIPQPVCAQPVTSLTAGNITYNSVKLSWTPPGNFLFISVLFKKKDDGAWIPVKPLDGSYIENTGYVFRDLLPDTHYDFQVIVTCVNGGYSAPEVVDAKTVCCT